MVRGVGVPAPPHVPLHTISKVSTFHTSSTSTPLHTTPHFTPHHSIPHHSTPLQMQSRATKKCWSKMEWCGVVWSGDGVVDKGGATNTICHTILHNHSRPLKSNAKNLLKIHCRRFEVLLASEFKLLILNSK